MDTRNKRASSVDINLPWRATLPVADSTVDADDRRHTGFFYASDLVPEPLPRNARFALLMLNPRFMV